MLHYMANIPADTFFSEMRRSCDVHGDSNCCSRQSRLAPDKIDGMLCNLEEIMPELLPFLPKNKYSHLLVLEQTIRESLKNSLSVRDLSVLHLLLKTQEPRALALLQTKLDRFLFFKDADDERQGKLFCKRNAILPSEASKKSKKSEKPKEEANATPLCAKCIRTETYIEKHKKELEATGKLVTKAEEKEKKYQPTVDKAEKALERAEKKVLQMTDRLDNSKQQLEDRKLQISEENRLLSKKFNDSRPISDEIKDTINKTKIARQELAARLQALKESEKAAISTLEDKKKKNEKLKAHMQHVSGEKAKLRSLMNMLSVNSPPLSPISTTCGEPSTTESELSIKLKHFQSIKRQMDAMNTVEMLDNVLDKFCLVCKDGLKIRQATEEVAVFRAQYGRFMAMLEYNIKIIMENPNSDSIAVLTMPEPPNAISVQFLVEFESISRPLVREKMLSSADGDVECVICCEDMEKSHRLTQCSHCYRKYHSKCLSEWNKKKKNCPVCSTIMHH